MARTRPRLAPTAHISKHVLSHIRPTTLPRPRTDDPTTPHPHERPIPNAHASTPTRLPNTEKRDLADQKAADRLHPGLPNTEKRDLADQKAADRLERIESFLRRHQALFATRGAVVATWRVYRNRRLGPYFQIVYRQAGRQRALYIGRSKDLADRLRRFLDRFQGAHRERRLLKRFQTQARASLRRAKAQLKELLALRGIQMKGFEFRGVRRALPLPPIRPAPSVAAPGKIPPYG